MILPGLLAKFHRKLSLRLTLEEQRLCNTDEETKAESS